MAIAPLPRFSVKEYLVFERDSPDRHEYIDGAMVAMAGGKYNHSLVIINVAAELRARLPQCRVSGSDLKVQVQIDRWIAYPDVVVTCDQPQFLDDSQVILLNPAFLVEVLSPGTRDFDRARKAPAYREMPSINGILLIEPEHVWLECWQRTVDGWLSKVITDRNGTLDLNVLGCQIPISEIYRGVELP